MWIKGDASLVLEVAIVPPDDISALVFSRIRSLPQYSAHSTESLEDDSTDHQYDKLESMLTDSETEAEAWSVTVDVKTLKKMTSKDIKRQNLIWGMVHFIKFLARTSSW